MDLVITLCDVPSGRPVFRIIKGGSEIPWYVFEVPVVVVGCGQPAMLADIQARTYINTYDTKQTIRCIGGASDGRSEAFREKIPVTAFCGLYDTHL